MVKEEEWLYGCLLCRHDIQWAALIVLSLGLVEINGLLSHFWCNQIQIMSFKLLSKGEDERISKRAFVFKFPGFILFLFLCILLILNLTSSPLVSYICHTNWIRARRWLVCTVIVLSHPYLPNQVYWKILYFVWWSVPFVPEKRECK